MTGPIHEFERLPSANRPYGGARAVVRGSVERAAGEPLVGLIYNPRSHRNRGADFQKFDRPGVLNARPDAREEIPGVIARFAEAGIDLLVINGGDGTVRDVLTAAQGFFSKDWPAIAVLPKGKTNALNVDLGAPADWSLASVIEAYKAGRQAVRPPLAFSRANDGGGGAGDHPMLGFILGAGAIAQGVKTGQSAHRLGMFDSLAVILSGAWGVISSVFGSDGNPWRHGAGLEIALGEEGTALPYVGPSGSNRRFLLLSTTLERLPMGIRPFGPHTRTGGEGIKIAALDHPRRWLVAMFPAIALGFSPRWLARKGYHQLVTDRFAMTIDAQFIVDGEIFPPGRYEVRQGPPLRFVVP